MRRSSGRSGRTRGAGPRERCPDLDHGPRPTSWSTSTSITVPGGLYFTALSTRFDDRPLELLWVTDDRCRRSRRRRRRCHVRATAGAAHRRRRRGRRAARLRPARPSKSRWRGRRARRTRSDSSPTSTLSASTTSCRSEGAELLARPNSSMFVRSVVSGVRISWLASEIRRCCCSRDVASAWTIVVKLRAKLPTSPSPSTGIGVVRSCVPAILLSGVTQVHDRSHDAAGQPPAEERGRGDAGKREHEEPISEPRQHVVDLPEVPRDLDDTTVLPRTREHPIVVAVDLHGLEPVVAEPTARSASSTGNIGPPAMHCVIAPVSVTSCAAAAGWSSPGCGQPAKTGRRDRGPRGRRSRPGCGL